jgi:hypothetical protein
MRYYFNEHNTSGIIWLATSLRRWWSTIFHEV